MASKQKTCNFFQLGICKNGSECTFAHIIDPNFKRKACQHFMKGKCNRGTSCKFSHDRNDIDHLKIAHGATGTGGLAPENSAARLKDFRWQVPLKVGGHTAPLGPALGHFFRQALELVGVEVGTMQEVITLLTSPGGLLRIDELLKRPWGELSQGQLNRFVSAQLIPFFQLLTHPHVTSSVLLRASVMTVYNVMYTGDGSGHRAIALFAALGTHWTARMEVTEEGDGEMNTEMGEAIDTTLAVLAKLVEVNTPAHANPDFIPIVETFAALLERRPAFTIHRARKNLERLQQRLGIGHALPDAQDKQKRTGARATFELARDRPGELSEEGRRHDNDYVNIQNISILPTLQEIQSSRNEYLPVADPREWHFGGVLGLLDRHFRLLREDTIGQLRDAVKLELERLQNPDRIDHRPKQQGLRTFAYADAVIVSAAFEEYSGVQVAIRFTRHPEDRQRSQAARKEWWEGSKRLGADALICLSAEGSVTFFVVAPRGQKPTQLQTEYDLTSDTQSAYVVAKPVTQSDIHRLLSRALGDHHHNLHADAPRSLVEFPGVLLPAFEPTLQAMQRRSVSLDVPFAHILAPMATPDNPDREVVVQPPAYAMKPRFTYDLSKITTGNESLAFAPRDSIPEAAAQLARQSTLDPGQALAVISSLARSFATIQGPPGTGKSYTGVQLVRVLLANKDATGIGPLLVCTQTNHALDAILERLVDDDAPGIVRIGGRSKSERLADVNLRVLAQRLDLTKTEKSRRWELTKMAKEETVEINGLFDAFASLGSEKSVEQHLRQTHPLRYRQLFEKNEDDFTLVSHKKGTILDVWLHATGPDRWRPRSTAELKHVSLHAMTTAERWGTFHSWMSEMQDELHERLRHSLSSYNESKRQLDDIKSEVNLRVLRQANIVGITTSGLARNVALLEGLDVKVLICEEAGEVLEAHTLTALLPSIEHCILIGDHQQLRPQVQNFDLSTESRHGGQYALDVSLFERLVQPQDMFAQPLPLATLEVQRRMHPKIAQLVRQTQYPRLQDAPSVAEYPDVVGMRHRLFWMQHSEPEDERSDGHTTSRTNAYEVDMIAAVVKHLVQQGAYRPADIAVITPYLGQLRKLRNKFSSTYSIILNDRDIAELENEGDVEGEEAAVAPPPPNPSTHATKGSLNQALRLATIDNFQGEEAKVVLISLVRSNKNNNPGFLRTPNRINVLLSRAQHGMYIFGNTDTIDSVAMWHDVIELFREGGNLGDALDLCCPRHPSTPLLVQKPSDFARLSPEAGCDLLCEKQLDCGHACVSKCHSAMLHSAVHCMKACARLKPGCEHLCPNPCGDKCDVFCQVPIRDVEITLDCGHTKTTLPCYQYQDPSEVVCTEPVQRTIPGCGHELSVACSIDVNHDSFQCNATCGDIMPCGHTCQKPCNQCKTRVQGSIDDIDHGKCKEPCPRGYTTCKHRCQSPCHDGEPCPLCTAQCDTRCSHARCGKLCSEFCSPCLEEQCTSGLHCPHHETCPMPCAAPCTWLPCSERCDRTLSCGCQCPSVCGEECPDATFCQKHGRDDVKAMQADLVMMTSYGDVDLTVDPCVFPPCGHVFTIDSLDGTMGMSDHYEIDPQTGKYLGLKVSAVPFSMADSKPCPECRGSLHSLARYGRIVRRALLDESAKKLTAWSNRKHHALATRLAQLEGELMGTLHFLRKPTQVIRLEGSMEMQMKAVEKFKTTKRYGKMYALMREIAHFAQKLSAEEQPYQRVHDLVEMVRRQKKEEKAEEQEASLSSSFSLASSIAEFEFSSEELQLREHLQAGNLLLRSHIILLSDIISVHNETPFSIRGTIHVDFTTHRHLCETLIAEATTSKNLRQEAEAHLLWAKFAAMECGIQWTPTSSSPSSSSPTDLSNLKSTATSHLTHITTLTTTHPALTSALEPLLAESASIHHMLSEGFSVSEMRMVVATMAKEFRGTGHWYRCANGHPFTVGECGMPMELARCPECGAGVGGQSHRPTEGVTRAGDIEERFGDLIM